MGASKPNPPFSIIGQRVRHATYGAGTIIAVEGEEPERKLDLMRAAGDVLPKAA